MNATVPRTYEGPAPREVLFEPYRLPGGLLLPNRILLAPCTRNRATADLSVTPGAVGYYAERARAGLPRVAGALIGGAGLALLAARI